MTDAILLKKYGNRRLYDTSESRYVTIAEVESMLQRGSDVRIVDAKTGEDLTKEVLVQIILEREGAREILPLSFLKQVVRVSNSPLKETFSRALHGTLQNLMDGQRAMIEAQRNMAVQMASQMPSLWNPFAAFAPAPSNPAPQPAPQARDPEIDRLRSELSETQAMLKQLLQRQLAADDDDARRSGAKKAPKPARRAGRTA